jgi:hypothetical protein
MNEKDFKRACKKMDEREDGVNSCIDLFEMLKIIPNQRGFKIRIWIKEAKIKWMKQNKPKSV